MRFLIASHFLPYPGVPHGGGKDLFALVEFLARRHEVCVLSLVRPGEEDAIPLLAPYCTELMPHLPASRSSRIAELRHNWRRALGHIEAPRHFSYRLKLRRAVAARPYDVIYYAYSWQGRFVEETPARAVCVYDEIDVTYPLLKRDLSQATSLKSLAERWMAYHEMRRIEQRAWRRADLIVTKSATDRAIVRSSMPAAKVLIMPSYNAIGKLAQLPIRPPVARRILFAGALNRRWNVEAIEYFVAHVWPQVRAAVPNAIFEIVGANPGPQTAALASQTGIQVTGYIPDLTEAYERADICIAPMLIGGGIMNKVVDAMAAGRPVVSTSHGVAGLPESARQETVVADRADHFALEIIDLLTNHRRYEAVGRRAREAIVACHDWPAAAARLEQYCCELRSI